jgi:hypothetical protein
MIVMTQRCHCGAELISGLAFCVTCGARRAERMLVGVGGERHAGGPAPVGYPGGTRPMAHPAGTQPMAHPGRPVPVAHPSLPPAMVPMAPVYAAPPAPTSRSAAPWIVGGASIVVLAVVAAVLVLTLRPAMIYGTTAVQQPTTVVVPSTTTVTTAPSSSSTGGSSATDQLDAQVAADRSDVENLTGEWVPQLSSKSVGTVADGITYDADDILGHYRGLAATYPSAKLLWSGDWPVFKSGGYWVVVAAQPFSTPAAANAWCSAHGLSADDCFAKKLSHTGGPAGTTVQR